MTPVTQNHFCGREVELESLRQSWLKVSSGDGPQITVLLAESGLGKTRLTHEFFSLISNNTSKGSETSGYWPSNLSAEGNNLLVNANIEDCNPSSTMPFLWWGLRLVDPLSRNCIAGGVLSHHYENDLKPHLEASFRQTRAGQRKDQAFDIGKGLLLDVAADFIPFAGLAKSVGQAALDLAKVYKDNESDKNAINFRQLSDDRTSSLNQQIIQDIHGFFRYNSANEAAAEDSSCTIPIIVFIDDAQFSTHDTGIVALTDTLIRNAIQNKWPIHFIFGHWEMEWGKDFSATAKLPTVSSILHRHIADGTIETTILRLRPIEDLSPIIEKSLPGLDTDQKSAILKRVDGNPRFLDEIIRLALSPRSRLYFEGRSTENRLTDSGLEELLKRSVGLHELISDRLLQSPEILQMAVTIASLQGVEFIPQIVSDSSIGLGLDKSEISEAIKNAETPHSYVLFSDENSAAFSQRIYFEVAKEQLPAWFDPQDAENSLRRCVSEILYGDSLGDFSIMELERLLSLSATLFEYSEDLNELFAAAFSLSSLAKIAEGKGDIYGGYAISKRLANVLEVLPDEKMDGDLEWLQLVVFFAKRLEDRESEERHINRILSITKQSYDENNNVWSAGMYAQALVHLGDFYSAIGKTSERLSVLDAASHVLQPYIGLNDDLKIFEIAEQIGYGIIAETDFEREPEKVFEKLKNNISISYRIKELDENGSLWKFCASRNLYFRGIALAKQNNLLEASQSLLSAVEIARFLGDEEPSPMSLARLCESLLAYGHCLALIEEGSDAHSSLSQARSIAEQLFAQAPIEEHRDMLERCQQALATADYF